MAAPARPQASVDAYGGGGFRISGVRVEGSVLILGGEARAWSARAAAELTPEDFAAVLALGPHEVEFVLLGAGPVPVPAPRAVREALKAAGVGLEIMDTPAASRLYNVLAGEGRRVAGALLAV